MTDRPAGGHAEDPPIGEDPHAGEDPDRGNARGRGLTAPIAALVAALALGLGLLGGWWFAAPLQPGDDSVDAGFARDMSEHHAQAVQMSLLVMQRTEDPDVRRLATDIATTQANQQGMMAGWLREWGLPQAREGERMTWMTGHDHSAMQLPEGVAMPGMASPDEIAALTASQGRDAEVLYLQLMTTHHLAGVEMAQAAVDGAADEDVTRLARTMVEGQNSEVTLMSDMLAERGAEPVQDPSAAAPASAPTMPGHAGH